MPHLDLVAPHLLALFTCLQMVIAGIVGLMLIARGGDTMR